MPEELETILRLVAEGHLTPDEAAPIIEAITRTEHRAARDVAGDRIDRTVTDRIERARARAESAWARAEERIGAADRVAASPGGGRQLRIRITERGRQVVNLRIPIGFVETALKFVPGLGGDQSQRIRDAVRSGAVGPVLDVEDPDGDGSVLISVE